MSQSAPEAVSGYLSAADAGDFTSAAAWFTSTGVVHDERQTHVGRDAIVAWREELASRFVWTTTVVGSEQVSDYTYLVSIHIEGNFPGGAADLRQRFELEDGLISSLTIGQ